MNDDNDNVLLTNDYRPKLPKLLSLLTLYNAFIIFEIIIKTFPFFFTCSKRISTTLPVRYPILHLHKYDTNATTI